jgi:hypothetical protein
MTNDSFLAVMFTSLIALFFGFVLTTGGYRFFLVLLPIWGFFYGFGLGAHSMQAWFGEGFLATVTSWLVGFVVAAGFAILSYLFYFFGVGLVAFSLGYALGVGLMQAIGFDWGFLPWLVGVALGGAVVFVTFRYNIQKYVIIGATSILGAGVIVGTFLYLFGGASSVRLVENPVRVALQASPFWFLVFIALAALGAVAQYQTTRQWEHDMREAIAEQPVQPVVDEGPPPGQALAS